MSRWAFVNLVCNDLVRIVLLVLTIGGTILLLVMMQPIPPELWAIDSAVVTFFVTGQMVKANTNGGCG